MKQIEWRRTEESTIYLSPRIIIIRVTHMHRTIYSYEIHWTRARTHWICFVVNFKEQSIKCSRLYQMPFTQWSHAAGENDTESVDGTDENKPPTRCLLNAIAARCRRRRRVHIRIEIIPSIADGLMSLASPTDHPTHCIVLTMQTACGFNAVSILFVCFYIFVHVLFTCRFAVLPFHRCGLTTSQVGTTTSMREFHFEFSRLTFYRRMDTNALTLKYAVRHQNCMRIRLISIKCVKRH